MHETQIVPGSIHHSDHDDLIVFYHKMNDVGESFDQAGAETIGGYREQPWVFQDTINRCHIFSQELISQADLLLVIPIGMLPLGRLRPAGVQQVSTLPATLHTSHDLLMGNR
jgi:hypothetical protein